MIWGQLTMIRDLKQTHFYLIRDAGYSPKANY